MIPHYQNDRNKCHDVKQIITKMTKIMVQVRLTTSMIPHYQHDENNVKVKVSLTTSMIPHYQNDENNVQGTSKFNNINDTPLPKRRK